MTARLRYPLLAVGLAATFVLLAGCRQDMHNQPKYRPYRPSEFFADGRSERPLVADTVARGHLRDDTLLYTGKVGEAFSAEFPMPVTKSVLLRGQQRYNIYCTPCHDRVGTGNGMIVQRGYKQPPSFHIDRLRQQPPGYFYFVMTNGFGVMPDYSNQVPVADRWAIAAYIRALQLSQNATLADVPAVDQAKLDAPPAAAAAPAQGGHHE